MYLGYQNGKIKFYTKEQLDPNFYFLDKVEETDKEYVLYGDEYVLKTKEVEKQIYKEQRTPEILKALEELDLKSIRALRANEIDRLEELESQAEILREELAGL